MVELINVLFFARVRDQLGVSEAQLELPDGVVSVELIRSLLQERGEPFESVLSDSDILVAVNQEMATLDTAVEDGDELAFFPPVTGG